MSSFITFLLDNTDRRKNPIARRITNYKEQCVRYERCHIGYHTFNFVKYLNEFHLERYI